MLKEWLGDILLINNVILIVFFITFFTVFAIASRSKSNKLDWLDLLLDSDTGKLSLSKFGNFFGIAISSWILIYFVQVKEAYSMFPSLFMAWLAFLGGVYTFNNFIKSRKKSDSEETTTETDTDTTDTKSS